jgi:diguanylate cyclase (GGDEF)-like protein
MNEFERRLINSPNLPTLPAVAQRVLELCNRDDTDLIQLGDTISLDPGVTTRVLRLINSPIYGLAREIVSIREAVLYLGFNAVHSVALSFSFVRSLGPGPGTEGLAELWQTSLMNALAARRLTHEVGGWDGEEAFLAGLVADCAAMLMYKMVPDYRDIIGRFQMGEADLLDMERASLPSDHMRLGELLLEAWRFPPEFRSLVGVHHESNRVPPDSPLELRARILTASWLCARALTIRGFTSETVRLDLRVAGLLGLPVPVVHAITSELPDELRETAAVFEIPVDQQLSFEELLEEANRSLSSLALEGEQALMQASQEGREYSQVLFTDLRRELASSLSIDEQSELLTRESFETVLEAFHRRARKARSSLGLMLIHVDQLKEVAPEIQGAVLKEVRERVETQTRGSDLCGRFTEDQVAVLIAGCWPPDLQHVAERVRVAVEGRPLRTDDRPAGVTIGVAATTPHLDSLDPRAFVRLACSALDRAQATPERINVDG